MRRMAAWLILALGLSSPAFGQARFDQARNLQPPPAVPFEFRAYAAFDEVFMTESQSFEAVVGTSSLTAGGVGVDVTDLFRGVFVRAGFSRMGGHGSRVFIDDDEIVPLNVDVAVRIRTLELGAGWRQSAVKLPRYVFYGGASLLRVRYTEVSDFATDEEKAPEGFWGAAVFGGVEYAVWKKLIAGGEIQWRTVPDALGTAGVSAVYDETNLGGFVIRGLIGFRK
jgi:hypothetical protein